MSASNIPWQPWQKILFRFFVVFLFLLSMVAYNPFLYVLGYGYRQGMQLNAHLTGFVAWIDEHVFRIGFLPQQHAIDFNDTHFGVVVTLTILMIAIASCVVWTWFDKERTDYNRFYYWFSIYLAYYIFLAMVPYAVQKIIPIQGHYPTAPELLTRWGDLRNWEVLFRFMGTSPGYCMFCGWIEWTASILLLFNRTRLLGGLLMSIALVQVVLFNICYNNNIIILSGTLLLSTLFIIARSLHKLILMLLGGKPGLLIQYRYAFTTSWKKSIAIVMCFLPLWRVYKVTTKSWAFYKGTVHNQKTQSLYKVDIYQQGNDTIPPLASDTTRWKYVCFLDYAPSKQQMVKFDMQDNQSVYPCKWDTVQKKIVLTGKDTASLDYVILSNTGMQLQGNWLGKNLRMMLTRLSIDSLTLVKDKFLFMQEDQN